MRACSLLYICKSYIPPLGKSQINLVLLSTYPYICIMKEKLNNEFWEWVDEHAADDSKKMWLKYGKTHAEAIVQVECRQRFGKKLAATLLRVPQWYFPSVLSGEQATGDKLAAFHSRLVPECARMADLTAGLGIDVLHCSGIASHIIAVEKDSEKAVALRHNMCLAGVENVSVECADCREWLKSYGGERLDLLFVDPARRSADGGRVFALADCEPDIVGMLPLIKEKASKMLVKVSPMLDISRLVEELEACVHIYVLGTPTECKELFALVDFDHAPQAKDDVIIDAVTVSDGAESVFRCSRSEEMVADAVYGVPRAGDYVCEPYPAVMKAGAVRLVAQRYGLHKLAANTHAYFGIACPDGFPGEKRRVEQVLPYASKVLKRFRKDYPRIEVAVRNFGMSAEALRAKLGVGQGGGKRLLAVTDIANEKWLIVLE